MKRSLFKKLQIASFLAGLGLLAYLIYRTGWAALVAHLSTIGWGFAGIVLLSGGRNYLRAASWYYAIAPSHRNISLWALNNVMLAGEAVKYLTSSGPFLSEPLKASLVRERVTLLHGSSSVAVENMLYYLSVFLFMLSGLPLLRALGAPDAADGFSSRLLVSSYIVIAFMVLGIVFTWLSVRGRWYTIAVAAGWLFARTPLGRVQKLHGAVPHIRAVEDEIYAFYEKRRGAFFLILSLNLAAHLANIVEVYFILSLMGVEASMAASYLIEVMTKLINLAFFFVPTRAGVYESGNAMVLDALGFSAGAGLALALIRKLRAFVWAGYGLLVLGLRP